VSGFLVEAAGLTHRFGRPGLLRRRRPVQAVTDLSLGIAYGETLGLVGESGSGKSTVGRLLLGLLKPTAGTIRFDGQDIGKADRRTLRALRRRMQMVFQDPYSSLDPRRRVGSQIADGLAIHGLRGRRERLPAVETLLRHVGLAPEHAARLPHEFSGGQRQRIGIARALATGPDFLVADEPVSALDVSVQAQVLALLVELRHRLGLAMLFISHDLLTVSQICDRTAVLYLGRIMEEGTTGRVLTAPRHPYTVALLSASPRLDARQRRRRIILSGDMPNPADPPGGCVFHTRCPYVMDICRNKVPALREFAGRRIACWRDDVPS